MPNDPTEIQTEDIYFDSEPSSVLADAIAEYRRTHEQLDQDEDPSAEIAWGVLANQVVGHENL